MAERRDAVRDWLLDADPAIRWQVLRDLTEASAATIAAERARERSSRASTAASSRSARTSAAAIDSWNRLLAEQLADGGWNCEAERGSVRSSFHTTSCVLEGLLAFETA